MGPDDFMGAPLQGTGAGAGRSALLIHVHSLTSFLGGNAFFSIRVLLFEILKGLITCQWELPGIFILVSVCLSSSLE